MVGYPTNVQTNVTIRETSVFKILKHVKHTISPATKRVAPSYFYWKIEEK